MRINTKSNRNTNLTTPRFFGKYYLVYSFFFFFSNRQKDKNFNFVNSKQTVLADLSQLRLKLTLCPPSLGLGHRDLVIIH